MYLSVVPVLHCLYPYRGTICKGRMAPLYIVPIASLLNPHDNFAALDRVCVSFAHLSATYFMFLKSEFLIEDYSQVFHLRG